MFRAVAPGSRLRLPPSGGYRCARRRPGLALPPQGTLAGRPPPAGHLSPSSSHRAAGGNDREGFRPVPVPRRRRGGVIPPDLGWTQVEAPWRRAGGGAMTDHRLHAAATLRNRDAILDVLRTVLPAAGTVLEIASGSGEHVVHFARALPHLAFQPSDRDPEALRSVSAWVAATGTANVRPPILLEDRKSTRLNSSH